MANYTIGYQITRPQGADLTGKQYYIVKQDTNGYAVLSAAATDKHIGVLAQTNRQGSTDTAGKASVVVHAINAHGTFKVIAGGTIAIGDQITSDANGKAVATTTSGDRVIGIAMEAATTGKIFEFMPMSYKV